MITNQAKRVRDALRFIGLRCRGGKGSYADFNVRTMGSGSTDKGFGDAVASIFTRQASELAYDKAEVLVSMGVSVMRYTYNGKKFAVVSSHYPCTLTDRDEIGKANAS